MKQLIVSSAIFFAVGCAHAQPESDTNPLQSHFDFFIGSCWSGTFSDGLSTDVQCFRSVYDGKFVRSNHLVEGQLGPYGGETIFSWDPDEATIFYTYWDTSGGVSRGSMIPEESGLRAPDETYQSTEGETVVISSRWTITGEDSWKQVVQQVSGETAETLWAIKYQRADISEGPHP